MVLVLGAVSYLPYRLTPNSDKKWVGQRVKEWCAKPLRLQLVGITVAVIFIQLVMRKCFAFGNILLREQLPDEWISSVLLKSDGKLALYFSGLAAGTLLTAVIAWQAVARVDTADHIGRFLTGLLVFLVAVEFLLLPVNYGVLISTQQLAQVGDFPADAKGGVGQRAWLVSNSKDNLTYFVYGPQDHRALVTVPRKDAPIRILAYDDIYCVLFSKDHSNLRPCPRF